MDQESCSSKKIKLEEPEYYDDDQLNRVLDYLSDDENGSLSFDSSDEDADDDEKTVRPWQCEPSTSSATRVCKYETKADAASPASIYDETDAFVHFLSPVCSQSSPAASSHSMWHEEPPQRVAIPFEGNSGIRVDTPGTTPLDFFFLLFTDSLVNNIVESSNDYAIDVLAESDGVHSRITRFKDITAGEFKRFLGVVFFMGLIRLNRLSDYWKTNYLFRLSVANFFSRDRFLLILKVLNFSSGGDPANGLRKIRPLIEFFNSKMDEVYEPDKDLSVYEHVSSERRIYGMKLYVLTEPTGFVQRLHVYSGAGDRDVGGTDYASKVVYKLIEGRTGRGHAIYTDACYSSVPLAESLLQSGTYCTGTLRPKRKSNPAEVTEAKLQIGEIMTRYTPNGICVCKWNNGRGVLAISSEFGADCVDVLSRRGDSNAIPRLVVEYRKRMKRVDKLERMLSYYPSTHKTLRWYKKLAIRVFHIMLVNSNLLYNRFSGRKIDLHDFQFEICQSLLPDPGTPIKQPTSLVHLPKSLPKGLNGKTKRKHCKYCMQKNKKRIDSVYCCSQCPNSPGFCLDPCFKEFHNY